MMANPSPPARDQLKFCTSEDPSWLPEFCWTSSASKISVFSVYKKSGTENTWEGLGEDKISQSKSS